MEEWWQTLHQLMEKCITAFGVAKRWCSQEDGKRRSSARINAEINGGTATLIRLTVKLIMSLYVPIVKSLLAHMGIRTENTAVMPAISRTDLEVAAMTKEQIQNEKMYLGTMTTAKNLLKQGIISDEEYEQIDTNFRKKYDISLSTLFTDIRLIKLGSYGNIAH